MGWKMAFPTFGRSCIVLLVLLQGAYSADFVGCSLGDFNDMAKQTGNPENTHVPFAYRKKLQEVEKNLSGITYFPSSNTLIGLRHDPPAIFEMALDGKVWTPCFPPPLPSFLESFTSSHFGACIGQIHCHLLHHQSADESRDDSHRHPLLVHTAAATFPICLQKNDRFC